MLVYNDFLKWIRIGQMIRIRIQILNTGSLIED
jgi:hypothetical protein